MATLEKIRSKAGLLVLVVGLALFAFIIGDFLNSGSTYFRQSQEKIAEIDGEVIKIQDFQTRVDEMAEMYKLQTGSASLSEEYMTQIRQTVFDAMVQEVVLDEAVGKLGMGVCPEEMFDMVQGENISPVIQQMQMFANPQTGAFDKAALLTFLKQINVDNIASYPADQQAQLIQAQNFWMFWEKNIKRQRLEQKYTTLLSKAISANAIDAKEAYNASSENSDVVYAMQAYSTIPDSTIEVSQSEIEKLYNQRKELYKQKESKVLKYIAVDIRPSKDDYDKVQSEIEGLKDELATSDRIADLVNENSEIGYLDVFFGEKALDAEMKQFVSSSEVGSIYGPAFDNDMYRMFKLVDKAVAPDSVKVSHILFSRSTEAETKALADSLAGALKGGADFAELAKQYSIDQSADKGGELGWFTEATALRGVNEEFKDAIFSTPLNETTTVKSVYGTHVVKVIERTANVDKYKIADIEMSVSPSSKTYSDIYNALNQFISNNNSMAKLTENAKEAGYNVVSGTVTKDDQMLGTIANSRQVIRWAFQNGKGDISEIFECNDKFVVATIEGTIAEGYRPLSMVSSNLRSELAAQKKGDKIEQELSGKNLTTVAAYAQAMNSTADSVKFVNFNTRRISGIGVEPKLNALISMAQVDQVSAPIKGDNGVYVFQVYARDKDDKEYNEADQMHTLNTTSAARVGYQAIQSMISHADIEDNRIRFY